jgi:hypothetical protein
LNEITADGDAGPHEHESATAQIQRIGSLQSGSVCYSTPFFSTIMRSPVVSERGFDSCSSSLLSECAVITLPGITQRLHIECRANKVECRRVDKRPHHDRVPTLGPVKVGKTPKFGDNPETTSLSPPMSIYLNIDLDAFYASAHANFGTFDSSTLRSKPRESEIVLSDVYLICRVLLCLSRRFCAGPGL